MPNLVLGVSGSIAAYRAADLARDLMREGFTVRVCLTDSAQKFVTPILFETLTGNPCLIDAFDEPERGRMAHLDWARKADILVIAPASANTINKLASGTADDMLSTLALAYEGPMIVAPAMNPAMYAHEATRASMKVLASRAAAILEPTEGDVVVGEHGQGKLASNATIVAAVLSISNRSKSLRGKRVLITSGPTVEPIDDVRYLSNRSSGKMGAALANAALLMGAEVTVVSGPSKAPYPRGAKVISVETAEEMLKAASGELDRMDIVVAAAAVADYRIANPTKGKIRRSDQKMTLELVPNPDVIATLAKQAKPGTCLIGFAAEPSADIAEAKAKMKRKGLHAIAHNDVSNRQIGFDSDQNQITLLDDQGNQHTSPFASKLQVAIWLLERCLNGPVR